MNLFFHPNNTKQFNIGSNDSILSQILRDPVPCMPIILDFTYLTNREKFGSEQVVDNDCFKTVIHQETYYEEPNFTLPTMTSVDFLNQHQSVQTQSTSQLDSTKVEADAYILHEMKQVEESQAKEESVENNFDSTEALLKAILQLNKNFNIQPASEFDNWFPMYSDLPMYDD
jgi:hypothetical protein